MHSSRMRTNHVSGRLGGTCWDTPPPPPVHAGIHPLPAQVHAGIHPHPNPPPPPPREQTNMSKNITLASRSVNISDTDIYQSEFYS